MKLLLKPFAAIALFVVTLTGCLALMLDHACDHAAHRLADFLNS